MECRPWAEFVAGVLAQSDCRARVPMRMKGNTWGDNASLVLVKFCLPWDWTRWLVLQNFCGLYAAVRVASFPS